MFGCLETVNGFGHLQGGETELQIIVAIVEILRLSLNNIQILICKSDIFGGANYLLDRLYKWLHRNNYEVEQCILTRHLIPEKKNYSIAILPSYIYDDIYVLSRMGIKVDRVLLWIMGMGCFQDGYYNPANTKGIKGFITKIIAKEAESALADITKHRSICFTDVVGRYNTYKDIRYADEKIDNDYLIPIGITTHKYKKHEKIEGVLKACWVGRVTHDFKFIPLKHILTDLEAYRKTHNLKVCFTVVGDGDAIGDVKHLINGMSYDVKYIPFLKYDDLDDFFMKQDIAFVMGTSALDAARNSCPAVIVTPVREGIDEEKVFYRWIYDSKGYSLGEYPGWDEKTGQVRKNLNNILAEFYSANFISKKCWEYTKQFDENRVFEKLLNCAPLPMDRGLWKHIKIFYLWRIFIRKYSMLKKIYSKYFRHL